MLSLEELQEEQFHAPPYSSAKDPVNICGFVAENVMQGKSTHMHWYELVATKNDEVFLLDVRNPEEHQTDTIEGSANIPQQHGFKTYFLATQKQSYEDIFAEDFIGGDDVIYQAVRNRADV